MKEVPVNKILQGNSLEVLKSLPDDCIDLSITSPPYYQLRDYGNETKTMWEDGWEGQLGSEPNPSLYVEHLVQIFHEVKRVIKPSGSFYLNIGDSYFGGCGGPQSFERKSRDIEWKEESIKNPHRRDKITESWLQPKQLMLIPSRVAIAMQNDGWLLRNDIIWSKCLASCTPIYAKSQGRVLRTSVRELDRLPLNDLWLYGSKGWIRVLSIEKQSKKQLITIHLRNGTKIESTPEHRFVINGELIEATKLKIGDKLDHAFFGDEKGTELGSYENGWIVGLFLAEGNYETNKEAIRFSLHKKEVDFREKIKRFSEKYSGSYREWNQNNVSSPIVNGKVTTSIIRHYVDGEGSKNKHLSRHSFNESNDFLKGVLDGWLDGDGHWEEKNKRYKFAFTVNRELEYDVKIICNRLKFFVRSRLRKTKGFGKEFPCIKMEIRKTRTGHFNQKDDYEIRRILKTKGYSYEISVDSDDHLFLLHDGTITHNSNPMPSSVTDRRSNSYEHIFFFVKNRKYFFDLDAVREPYKLASVKRIDYPLGHIRSNANGQKAITGFHSDTEIELNPLGKTPKDVIDYSNSKYESKEEEQKHRQGFSKERNDVEYNPLGKTPKDIITISTESFKGAHFATFGVKLISPFIKSSCPDQICKKCGKIKEKVFETNNPSNVEPRDDVDAEREQSTGQSSASLHRNKELGGVYSTAKFVGYSDCGCNLGYDKGIVLDPFMGSGTTAVAAYLLGRNYLGIELNPKYIKIAEERIKKTPRRLDEWEDEEGTSIDEWL